MGKVEQLEFDFGEKPNKKVKKERRPGRPHHRTTMLTTNYRTFRRVLTAEPNEEISVAFCNDIISSALGGGSVEHHAIRRIELLRRQISGGYTRVKIRSEQGDEIPAFIVSEVSGERDDCFGTVWVSKTLPKSK